MPNNTNENLFSGAERQNIYNEVKDVTTPVRADDFIHIQVQFLLKLLRRQENDPKDYMIERKYKEEVISNLYKSNAQPFKSTEQQLGKFFQPIINKLVIFQDEVLIDFREGVPDDSKKV